MGTFLMKAAREAGVKKLVLLSGRGEHNAVRCEDIVRESGVPYAIVRGRLGGSAMTAAALNSLARQGL